MSKKENTSKVVTPLFIKGFFETVDLPDENRSGVIKIINPSGWNVALYKLDQFKNHVVDIRFSADVKRIETAGDLRWQINNSDYPTVGNPIENAEADIWYSMKGEWTGTLINNRVFYLSTYNSNSKTTIYYIDNFKIEIVSKGMKEKKDLSNFHKSLKDMAEYLKNLIPVNIPNVNALKPMFKSIADEESIWSGILAYRDFLYLFCDRLIADGSLYDKPPKIEDSHASVAVRYPLLYNVKNVLLNIGYYGIPTDNDNSLLLNDWKLLAFTTYAEGGQATLKLSVSKIIEALRFLTYCGFYFDGIDLDTPKPNMSKIISLTVTYPDNPVMLIGLRVMAIAQKDLAIKGNDEAFLRCDYRILCDEKTDVTSLLKDFIRSLPDEVQDFALKLHQRYINAGLICKPKVSFFNIQFFYSYKNKEVWSFYASLISGYRILIKAQNTKKYADVIEKFSLPLQEIIAKGYGCQKKRFDEPCQKGCHGFSFSLNDSILEISKDIEVWLDNELS